MLLFCIPNAVCITALANASRYNRMTCMIALIVGLRTKNISSNIHSSSSSPQCLVTCDAALPRDAYNSPVKPHFRGLKSTPRRQTCICDENMHYESNMCVMASECLSSRIALFLIIFSIFGKHLSPCLFIF